jgi:hypothetical protein
MSPSKWTNQIRIEDRGNGLEIWVITEWIRDISKDPVYPTMNGLGSANIKISAGHLGKINPTAI